MKCQFFLVLFLLFSSYSWATTKIMPLGNSITLSRANHSYRYYLQQLLENGGYAFDFIGTQKYQSYTDFDPDHEGHGGYTADQIAYYLPQYLASTGSPDVVLLHIGHNNQFKGHSVESTISDIENIIDILQADNPSVTILLAQIINPNYGHAWWDRLNALIPGVASGKTTVNSTVVAVDMNAKFVPSTMTYDKIHPNDKGNEIIAEAWYAAYVSVMVPLGNAYHIDPDNTVGSMKLKIYPNPSDKNDVTIEYNLPSTYGVRIEIINETGKPVKTLTPGKQKGSIQTSLSGYAPGMYFFRLIAGDKSYVEKFILN